MAESDKNNKKKKTKKTKIHYIRLLGCVAFPLAIILGIGIWLYRLYEGYATVNQAKVQAEIQKQLTSPTGIVLPSSDSGDPLASHPETQAIVPFNKTVFTSINDYAFHYTMIYPSNTTFPSRNADGDQIWFLRRNGYMFKLDIYPSSKAQSLQDFVNAIPDKANYLIGQTTLSGVPAFILTQIDVSANFYGNEFVIKDVKNNNIFVLWYQVYPDNKYHDDNLRIQSMLQSFRLI